MSNPERHKIEQLKNNWFNDPCWDIEDTEGFEDYYIELKAYRIGCELEWNQDQAKELNCSTQLADYVLSLEWKLAILNNKLDRFMREFGH